MIIPKDVSDANTEYVNLLTNHGEINFSMITKFEQIYMKGIKISTRSKYSVSLPDESAFKIWES